MNVAGYHIRVTEQRLHGLMILVLTALLSSGAFFYLSRFEMNWLQTLGLVFLVPIVSLYLSGYTWNFVYNRVIKNGE